jgi:hypothetical protein
VYAVLTNREGRSFVSSTGETNLVGIGPFMSSREALAAADGVPGNVIEINPKSGVTDRILWRDIQVTEVWQN